MNAIFGSLAHHVPPPYRAVVFTYRRTETHDGFSVLDARLYETVRTPSGFWGMNPLRIPDGRGRASAYWKTREDIEARRMDQDLTRAKQQGPRTGRSDFWVELRRVAASYGKDRDNSNRPFSYSSVCV